MRRHLIVFLAGLTVAGAVGCNDAELARHSERVALAQELGYSSYTNDAPNVALLDKRLTDRLNASELHLSQRLERIEANQTALMLRFGFRPEGGR